MKPSLASFKLCPYAQRAAIVLAYKGVDHDIQYVDPANPPAWFLSVSPLKKVPVLLVGDRVVFESTVISEFLDELYPGRLHPEDIFARAMNRSWINLGNDCMADLTALMLKKSQAEFLAARDAMRNRFDQLEPAVRATPYFNGPDFSLVDSAYAPLFQRLDFLDAFGADIYDARRHPKITEWKAQLLVHDSVRGSSVPDLHELFCKFLYERQGYAANFL